MEKLFIAVHCKVVQNFLN